MGDPFGTSWISHLKNSWKLALLLFSIIGFFGLFYWFEYAAPQQPSSVEIATVVGFGSFPSELGDRPLVRVKLGNGSEKALLAPHTIARMCTIGDRIRVVKKGIKHRIGPQPCADIRASQ
ncbi:hypothetical protein OAS19_04625 [Altererythrobacter sp.]|nr:hypothetical protein [Altererythrobacter sp.]